MFEISILCVIAIAIGQCATLWIMGPRDDVIYGQFIQTEQFPAVNLEPQPAPMRSDVESMMREIRDATYGQMRERRSRGSPVAYSPARAETRGILLRGWFGEFSTGLDAIADARKAKGIRAEVAGHPQWKTAADEIRRESAQGKTDAIVLVGHSQGANNVIDMARVLEAQNVPVCCAQGVAFSKTGEQTARRQAQLSEGRIHA